MTMVSLPSLYAILTLWYGSQALQIGRNSGSQPNNLSKKNLIHFFNLPSERPSSSIGEIIEFELLDGKVAFGTVNQVHHRDFNDVTWFGTLSLGSAHPSYIDTSEDVFILSCHKHSCSATLDFESISEYYKIEPSPEPDNEGLHSLSNYDKSSLAGSMKMITEDEALKLNVTKPHMPRMNAMNMMASATVDTDLIVDIGVIYTPQAKAVKGR